MANFDNFVIESVMQVPTKVYRDMIPYISQVHNSIINNRDETFPGPMEFNIDFSDTKWEYLNALNPRIILTFMDGDSHKYNNQNTADLKDPNNIKRGIGYIKLGIQHPDFKWHTDVISLEHEMLHFIQNLSVTWRIRNGKLPNIPIEEYPKFVAGMPSKNTFSTKELTPKQITARDLEHHKRPIEFIPRLNSILRNMQYRFHEGLNKNPVSNKSELQKRKQNFFNNFISTSKMISDIKAYNKDVYLMYLKKLYTAFFNEDWKSEYQVKKQLNRNFR